MVSRSWITLLLYHLYFRRIYPFLLPSLWNLCPTRYEHWNFYQASKKIKGKFKKIYKNLENSHNHAIIMHRDKSLSSFLQESAWLLETHRKPKLILLLSFLWKHKTVATLEPIRGVPLFEEHKWRWNHVATSFLGCRFLFFYFHSLLYLFPEIGQRQSVNKMI